MSNEAPPVFDEVQERWVSCHLYYHQDLNRVLTGFVHPLMVSLVRSARVEAFFFVRYGLGGPHVRLRLRALPGFRDQVVKEAQQAAQDFLTLAPSTTSLEEKVVRKNNESILAFDPNETDDTIYPDNSFWIKPFRPEIQRYGGPNHFRKSLDFFTLSSVMALDFLTMYGNASRSAQLAHAFRILFRQALGFAADEIELSDLLRYGMDSWGGGPPQIIEKGDKVFDLQRDTLLQFFYGDLVDVRSLFAGTGPWGKASDFLVLGAGRLSAALNSESRSTRARIGGSQLHLTATRLGISNVEEVYLSRLLTLTLGELLTSNGETLSWRREKIRGGAVEPQDKPLGDLLPPALAVLAEVPASPLSVHPLA